MPAVSCIKTRSKYTATDASLRLDQQALADLRKDRRLSASERRNLIVWFRNEISRKEKSLRKMSPAVAKCRREGR